MDLKTLRALVRQGEGKHLEFKLKAAHPEKIVKEMVAFANAEGGKVIIGVSDDKLIKGVKFPDEEEYILLKAIEKYCFPAIPYTLQRLTLEDDEKEILIFDIASGNEKPYFIKPDNTPNLLRAYVRVADRSVQASKEMKEVLKGERKQRNYRFEYGEKEKKLIIYLTDHQHITVDEFAVLASIPKPIASRTLVLLVLAGILKISPDEEIDFFILVLPV
jgi:predicted HTH transcriptional regulator